MSPAACRGAFIQMPYQDFLNERTQQGGTQESKGNGNKEVDAED